MAQNKLDDLRDHLFAQLERLNDESIKPEKMELEISKAKAMTGIAKNLISSAKIEIDFLKTTGTMKTETQFFKNVGQTKQLEP